MLGKSGEGVLGHGWVSRWFVCVSGVLLLYGLFVPRELMKLSPGSAAPGLPICL